MGDDVAPVRRRPPAFWIGVAAIAVVALVVRVAYIWFLRRGLTVGGDSRYYHEGANLLADGKGFIEPFLYLDAGTTVQAADHPPMYILYLAAYSLVGLTGATAHMLASALVGVVTVVVTALVGRELAGPRAGLVAGALAALYPNLWSYDGGLEAETMAQLGVALILLATYVWRRAPTRRGAALLGTAIAFAALSRAELLLLTIALVGPLVVRRAGLERRERVNQLVTAWVVAGTLVAPWCVYNLTRFERPVLLSGGFEITLDSASCDETYYGDFTGFWSRNCVVRAREKSGLPENADRSVLAAMYRADALDYISENRGRLPAVVAARLGRVTGLWSLRQQASIESFLSTREPWVTWSGWWSYFALVLLSVVGVVELRKRRLPVFPLLAFPALVLLVCTITFGQTRYRAIAEPSIVILGAIAIDAAAARIRAGRPVPDGEQPAS